MVRIQVALNVAYYTYSTFNAALKLYDYLLLPIQLNQCRWFARRPGTLFRIVKVMDWIRFFGGWAEIERFIEIPGKEKSKEILLFSVQETHSNYGEKNVDVPF